MKRIAVVGMLGHAGELSGRRRRLRIALLLLLAGALLGCRVQFNPGTEEQAPISSGTTAEQAAARRVATTVVARLDAGQWSEAWSASASSLKKDASLKTFTMGVRTSRAMFGVPKSRAIAGYAFPASVDGAAPGKYGIVFYTTDFSKVAGVEEQVVLVQEAGEWRLAGYWANKRKKIKLL